MTKEELAIQYASQKAEELAIIIQEAYLKGYEQGFLNANKTISVDGIQYVDLGLPSGTLWSRTSLQYEHYGYKQTKVSYYDALNMQIPTVEQWEEVRKFCHCDGLNIIGPNGGRIGYGIAPGLYPIYSLGEHCEEGHNKFWLKGDVDSKNNAPTMIFDFNKKPIVPVIGTSSHFIGFQLPVFLVKKKE